MASQQAETYITLESLKKEIQKLRNEMKKDQQKITELQKDVKDIKDEKTVVSKINTSNSTTSTSIIAAIRIQTKECIVFVNRQMELDTSGNNDLVYLIRLNTNQGPVLKVGHTNRLQTRMVELCGNSKKGYSCNLTSNIKNLVILGIVYGSLNHETAIHNKLSKWKVSITNNGGQRSKETYTVTQEVVDEFFKMCTGMNLNHWRSSGGI